MDSKDATGVMESVRQSRELFNVSDTLRKRELLKSLQLRADLYHERIMLYFRFAVNPDGTNALGVPLKRGREQRECAEKVTIADTSFIPLNKDEK
jgi:hypothetical protein